MLPTVVIAGSGNVTGHGIAKALRGWCNVVGYDACDAIANPANLYCINATVPRSSDVGYPARVEALLRSTRPLAIIPSNDHDLRALQGMRSLLHDLDIVLNGDSQHAVALLDKRATSRLFQEAHIACPQVVSDVEPRRYPYVVRKQRVGEGKKFVYIVRSEVEERRITDAEWAAAFVTRFVEGGELTIDVLCDQLSNVLSAVPRARLEVRNGMVHRGEVVEDAAAIARATELARALRLTGINCVQCIRTDDEAYFFEVNCRPGSGLSLTTEAGINMPRLWIESLLGAVPDVPQPDWGLKMTRYFEGYYHK
jgi:carbamoyl-phosphate synthase large subunit